ncbi:MAG: FAD-binding protein [Myxococcota bacterium]
MIIEHFKSAASLDPEKLRSAILEQRAEQGIAAGRAGEILSQGLRASEIGRDHLGNAEAFKSRIAYAIANPDVDVDRFVTDVCQQVASHERMSRRGPGKTREVNRVTVQGAGPAGLSAAIVAAEQGARVTVLERGRPVSEPVREHPVFNCRVELLDAMERLGVYEPVMRRSGFMAWQSFHNAIDGARFSLRPHHVAPGFGPPAAGSFLTEFCPGGALPTLIEPVNRSLPTPLSKPARAQIAYGDLVNELVDRALALGVEIVEGVEPHVNRTLRGALNVVGKPVDGGSGLDVGTVDLHIVASGNVASNSLPRGLKMETLHESPAQAWVGGLTRMPLGGVVHRLTKRDGGDTVRGIAIGHGQRDLGWMLHQLPSRLYGADEATLRTYWRENLQELLDRTRDEGFQIEDRNVLAGADRAFNVQLKRQRHMTLGTNDVLVLGDAAHKAHFLTSYGVHLALGADMDALRVYLSAAESVGVDAATWLYQGMMDRAADEWQGGSFDEFYRHDRPVNLLGLVDPLIPKIGPYRVERSPELPLGFAPSGTPLASNPS